MSTEFNYNPLPEVAALCLCESGISPDTIQIQPESSSTGQISKRVLNIHLSDKTGWWHIQTGEKQATQELFEEYTDSQHPLRVLSPLLQHAITALRVDKTRREQRHLLGLSPFCAVFFPEIEGLDRVQKNIFTFLLLHRSQISGDRVLTAKCLAFALDVPVSISNGIAKNADVRGAVVSASQLDAGNAIAGGGIKATKACLDITVGPVEADRLHEFVTGARQWRFLTQYLLPVLLQDKYDWRLQVKTVNAGRVSDNNSTLFIGLNSTIQ